MLKYVTIEIYTPLPLADMSTVNHHGRDRRLKPPLTISTVPSCFTFRNSTATALTAFLINEYEYH